MAIELPVARVGSRILAATIDYTLLTFLLLIWVVGSLALGQFIGISAGWSVGVMLFGMFAIDYGYFALQEIFADGQTLGKRWVGLRVVSRDGSRADGAQLAVRNLVRSIDVLVGALLMAIDPLARRLGDRLAGTLVLHQSPDRGELILSRVPAGWQRRDVEVIEAFLRRAETLEVEERAQLSRRLTDWIDERAPGFLPAEGDSLTRLERGFLAPGESAP